MLRQRAAFSRSDTDKLIIFVWRENFTLNERILIQAKKWTRNVSQTCWKSSATGQNSNAGISMLEGKMDSSYSCLHKFLPLFLVQDKPNALSIETITERLALQRLCYGRNWLIRPCNAKSGEGLWDGLEWLSQQLVAAGVMDLAWCYVF